MRKKFIFFAIVPLIAATIIIYLFAENWVESGIEYSLEEVVGAKVEIDNLNISLSPLSVSWDRMQVTNPYSTFRNLFETGKTKCVIDENQLLRSKVIIETIEMENLVFQTKRATDGKLPADRQKGSLVANTERTFTNLAEQTLKNALDSNPILDVALLKDGFNPDSLVKAFNFQTLKNIDTLKNKISKTTGQWDKIKSEYESSKTKILEIETSVKNININELNNAQNILAAITTADNAIKSINEIKETVTKRTGEITGVVGSLAGSVDSIDNFIKNDYAKLKNAARLPTISTPGIAQFLVGNEMYERVKFYLAWVDIARNNIKKYTPEPEVEKPARFEGQDIKFPVERGYPDFWIKNVAISVGNKKLDKDGISARGIVKNITDNQDLSGYPLTIDLSGTKDNIRELNVNALFDRRGTAMLDQYGIKLSGVPLSSFQLGKETFLPSKITNSNLTSELELKLINSAFDSKIHFLINNINLEFSREPKTVAEILVGNILKGITSMNVELRLWNTKGYFDIALATDLDEQISKRLIEVVGAELQKLERDLKAKFDTFMAEQVTKFNSMYVSKLNDVKQNLDFMPEFILSKLDVVGDKKKELQDKLDKEKNNLIQNKLQDIFKKK